MEVGRIIGGKYRLRRQVGEGGMGSVWSAVHETLGRTVAIKFLRPSHEDAETASARFVDEAKSAARLKHRFVVDVFDFGITEDGVYYMVQELLEGEELAACMNHGPAWEARNAVQLIAQCLSGLEAVHQAGIVHRDLKPENIFVMRDSDGRYPKLLDFGISKLSDPSRASPNSARPTPAGRGPQLTGRGITLGTPWYMSPEQLRGRKDLDGRADIYSMGVILYEWLTGRVPYEHDNSAELVLMIAAGKAQPLVSLRPELGHDLSSVIARALAPERDYRFASAAEMREALTTTIAALPREWTIVQKAAKAAPADSAKQAFGARTELLLKSAADPFSGGDEDARRTSLASLKRYIRPWMWGVAAVLVAALFALPFFLHAHPERANAMEEEALRRRAASAVPPVQAEAAAKAAPAPLERTPAEAEAPPTANTLDEASSTGRSRSTSASDASAPRMRVRSSDHSSAGAGPRRSGKKVIRKLDF